ncbi:hypothetical protein CHLNCDRAFT_132920 [Chlorella variabilis]|uniref:Uncharacterized protein n=1 Tax=Chlorella variabilis TaxID=554065 RepID=E1Z1Y4_CHLVA|nr:hypothetical protein CHLNCDRAFT_132920 [Chlorella variabilis]EFN59899.1 hypothetical protein CHLNCDRAFT_132920 [Chlorella variabilis]|eukprot:XP_005852001.1 hypothetical protein CHLNCDRAFT_132920 [Chlorella variabilis]
MGLEEQLVQACERSDAPAVARLLQQGANPAAAVTDPSSYHYQWKPLHTTIYNAKGSSQVVELLVSQQGVDVNEPTANPQHTTPLHITAWHCPSLVPLLLKHGARVNATDGYRQTAPHDAAFHGHADAVAALL